MSDIFQTVAFVEIDPTACNVLSNLISRRLIESATIIADVRQLKKDTLRQLNPQVITAGFPCQDISIAKHDPHFRGLEGDRSGLVKEIFRIIRLTSSVQVVFLENSNHIVKRGLETILQELSQLGFRVAFGIFSAYETGALHLRRRWYCLAVRGHVMLPKLPGRQLRWKNPDSVPRVVLRGPESRSPILQRCSLLGNAVVPATVRLAYSTLSKVLTVGLPTSLCRKGYQLCLLDTNTFICVYRRVRDVPKKSIVRISAGPVYNKPLWATPTHSHWVQYRNIAPESNVRKLVSQIFWDDNTVKYVKDHFGYEGPTADSDKYFNLNPEWVEMLMGFPRGWTQTEIP